MAAWSSPTLAWRSRTWRTTSGRTTAQRSSARLGGAVDQLPLKGQQLRRREPLHAQPAVVADPDGPLLEEPVGRLLGLGERLLRARGDREALGQGVHHVRPGEGGRLSGQPVRAGQRVQRGVQLCPSRWTAPSTRADLGQLALAHPLLRELSPPPRIDALLGLASSPWAPWSRPPRRWTP